MIDMNIFILAGNFPPDIGGPANYLPSLSLALAERGHTIEILCFSDVKIYDQDHKWPFRTYRILRTQSILIRELKTLYYGVRLASKADVIYSNGNDFKAFLIGLIVRKPTVHKIVGDVSWERAQNRKWFSGTLDQYQNIKNKGCLLRVLDWARSFPLRRAAAVITPSLYLKEVVSGWGIPASKIRVVYNSFHPTEGPLKNFDSPVFRNPNLKFMCTIGRLVPWKGIDTLIQSLTISKDLALIVIGDGPLGEQLKALAKELKVDNRVLFTGRQDRNQIKYFLTKSHFFILNSSYEGLPHVVLEAMSCKCLVVASNVGGTPELVQNRKTGILFEYNKLDSIQSAIKEALSGDHEDILRNAQQLLQSNFSFDEMIQQTARTLHLAKEQR